MVLQRRFQQNFKNSGENEIMKNIKITITLNADCSRRFSELSPNLRAGAKNEFKKIIQRGANKSAPAFVANLIKAWGEYMNSSTTKEG